MSERSTDTQQRLLDALAAFTVHDVTAPIEDGMPVWFRYDSPTVTPVLTFEADGVAANRLEMSEHTGTHLDAPSHTVPGGLSVDRLPPDHLLCRPFKKYDLSVHGYGAGESIGVAALQDAERRAGFALEPGDVAIIETGWDRHSRQDSWWGRNQPGLDRDSCLYLAEQNVAVVASDTPACDVVCRDGQIESAAGHRELFLPRGILILEGLAGLAAVPATGLLLALPLPIRGGTGSPVRVLVLTERR